MTTSVDAQQTSDLKAQVAQREQKLDVWRNETTAYPNGFKPSHSAAILHEQFDTIEKEPLAEMQERTKVAGRIILKRVMGKASFITIRDQSSTIQLYLKRDDLPEGHYQQFKHWDLGDIVGAEGTLFKTKTGELSVHVDSALLLTKCLRPLPDKFHGLADQEMRYRQRYLDLIVNPDVQRTFELRSKIVDAIRLYLKEQAFLEVETPMMQSIPGGATARPFVTHHNALDMPLFLRIAPELYLKRLVVGGFERVFEINRNFRNEGLSTQHNPEFTMLEFYQAYATYEDLMNLTEDMFKTITQSVLGQTQIEFEGTVYDYGQPFTRLPFLQALVDYNPSLNAEMVRSEDALKRFFVEHEIAFDNHWDLGKLQLELFEKSVERQLQQPTFVTDYPTTVSPLARQSDSDPSLTERFELFIAGREIANGFSELNDPQEQARRFQGQVDARDAGDDEAMYFDDDYIRALEYGLPPTAGEGIGIDRLVMLLTNSPSIRDVLLFPQMRHKESID